MYIRMELTGGILDKIDNIVDYAGKHYSYLSVALYSAYIVLFLGVVNFNPSYITELKLLMQVVICVVLIYRFNPFRTHELKKYDANIIFSSAMFLLVNTGIAEVFERYWLKLPLDEIHTIIASDNNRL
jgi:hypothetical protein